MPRHSIQSCLIIASVVACATIGRSAPGTNATSVDTTGATALTVYRREGVPFELRVPRKMTFSQDEPVGERLRVVASAEHGLLSVTYWQQDDLRDSGIKRIDAYISSTLAAGHFRVVGEPADAKVYGAVLSRRATFVHETEALVGEIRVARTDRWVVACMSFAGTGSDWQRAAPAVMDSFRLVANETAKEPGAAVAPRGGTVR